jgi:mono/diheme cytochrome c family protein
MRARSIGGSILLTFMTAALGYGQSAEQAAAGRRVYEARCQSCHMLTGEPVEVIERTFQVEMRDLSSEEVQAKEPEQLSKDILEGTGKMRPVANLDSEAVANLIAYLRSLAEE